VTLLSLASEEDWLWRPVRAGMCKAESIVDGTLDLEMIATLNEVLDIEQENQLRLEEWRERNRPRN
jgi:hypothetical protein